MDLDDLLIFCTAVREGGVNRAASRLSRVPSNVSTRIKQLEARLDVRLFRRQGRELALTDAGRKLLHHAERLLHMADIAERDIRSSALAGVLKLGSLESAAGARLPPIFSKFHESYPDVRLELKTGTTSVMLDLLGRYEVEAAFVSEPFERGKFDATPIFEEELVLITARN
ncbi:MAG: LysR family transcriptional regulator, partial [Hyphomicrobiales bacterium]|nr:LysR family transcriptional regulator [Hyphomicrobiales bacterium]